MMAGLGVRRHGHLERHRLGQGRAGGLADEGGELLNFAAGGASADAAMPALWVSAAAGAAGAGADGVGVELAFAAAAELAVGVALGAIGFGMPVTAAFRSSNSLS